MWYLNTTDSRKLFVSWWMVKMDKSQYMYWVLWPNRRHVSKTHDSVSPSWTFHKNKESLFECFVFKRGLKQLPKTTISFVMSVRPYVCIFVSSFGIIWIPLEEIIWILYWRFLLILVDASSLLVRTRQIVDLLHEDLPKLRTLSHRVKTAKLYTIFYRLWNRYKKYGRK
jgi:hypothetical protein